MILLLLLQITDDSESILPIEPQEQIETYAEKMFKHLTRVIKERDDFAEVSLLFVLLKSTFVLLPILANICPPQTVVFFWGGGV